jgi:hypothetical protein
LESKVAYSSSIAWYWWGSVSVLLTEEMVGDSGGEAMMERCRRSTG